MVYAALRSSRKNIKLLCAICCFYKDRDRIVRVLLQNGMDYPFLKLEDLCILFHLIPYCSHGLLLIYISTMRERIQQFPSPVHQNM